jgi:hypothetical protein
VATAASFLALATTASAAGTWFVKAGAANTASCGTAVGTPCGTVTFVLAKAAFVSGDTINVAAGTYTDHPLFSSKTATVNGAGAASTIFSGTNTSFALGTLLAASQTLTLNDITLTAGSPTAGTGGGLAIGGGQIITSNVNLTNNKAQEGAGAYVIQGASLRRAASRCPARAARSTSPARRRRWSRGSSRSPT